MLAGADGGPKSDASHAERVRAAAATLLAARRAQPGRHTHGDAADQAFVAVLSTLPLEDEPTRTALVEAGSTLGRAVFAKTFLDAPLAAAIADLAQFTRAAGLGSILVEDTFHRTAILRLDAPTPAASHVLEGTLAGFLSECFNCSVTLVPAPDGRLRASLGEGRDVNREARR